MRIKCVSQVIYYFEYFLLMINKDLDFWRLLGGVKRGRQRRLVLKQINPDSTITISEITRKVNEEIQNKKDGKEIRLRDVSRVMKWLLANKLIKCLKPYKNLGDKGMTYKLTTLGRNIYKEL